MSNQTFLVNLSGLVALLATGLSLGLGCMGPQQPDVNSGPSSPQVSSSPGAVSSENVDHVEQNIVDLGEANIHFTRGVRLFSQLNPDFYGSAREFLTAISLDPKHALAIGNLGVVRYEQGQFGKAEKLLKRALHLKPNYTRYLYNLALVYGQQERWELAVKTLEKVLIQNPHHRDARRFLPKFRQARDKQRKTAAG